MSTDSVNSVREVLNSWKEIASYLNRGVRTVQRWEIEQGLPVRRFRGRDRSAVFALRADLDLWIRSRDVRMRIQLDGVDKDKREKRATDYAAMTLARTSRLILEQIRLCQHSRNSRAELNAAIARLRQTMSKLLVSRSTIADSPPPV